VPPFLEFRILLSLSHDFHNHSLVPLPIKFGIKNPLPRPQIEFTPGNGHYDLMMNEQRFRRRRRPWIFQNSILRSETSHFPQALAH
jgi:hypothetical protein